MYSFVADQVLGINGLINLSSLASVGFATGAYPDWQGLQPFN